MATSRSVVLVGGSGFVGSAVREHARTTGRHIAVVDRRPPLDDSEFHQLDLLTDPPVLPEGRVVLLAGNSDPRSAHPWQLVLDNALATARLLPALANRDVTLISSAEVYGRAPAPLTEQCELPLDDAALTDWCDKAIQLAQSPCPPWLAAPLCRELAEADPTGRWVYGLAKRAQELLAASVVPANRLTIFRAANLFGHGQDRVVARITRRALVGLPIRVTDSVRTFVAASDLATAVLREDVAGLINAGTGKLRLTDLAKIVLEELDLDLPVEVLPSPADDSTGDLDVKTFLRMLDVVEDHHLVSTLRSFVRKLSREVVPQFSPPLPVVIPPLPFAPDRVAARSASALQSGVLKSGGPLTTRLAELLSERLELTDQHTLLATASGTAALRLAVLAVAGPASPGQVAVLPSFTFVATGEALAQLGYKLRFCDVDPLTWTLDPQSLETALRPGDVSLVVAVDTLGAPADYPALRTICDRYGVQLVADSAPALGSTTNGRPVGSQADAHSFSMSFAKVVSAAGAGGFVVIPSDRLERLIRPVDWTRSSMLGEVHAAAAVDLVERLDILVERRRRVAEAYAELIPAAIPQQVLPGDEHAWVHWVARFPDRDRLAEELGRRGVGTKPYYAPVLHSQDWQGHAEPAVELPVTDTLAREVLALPMSSEMNPADAERVVCAVLGITQSGGR
ncbi:NAD-dependent epimerase/dehydratase family protein [Kribbella qitaiheensis]|uniref:NAD-dependent epimerase/dehydratase family protein n=1 Tax=Kribbella qitaiheensis TaxID=1544730 RepID=A0A7G6WT45_9ACTN|nr:DegT/DnrJ/EryC1/StrS family aminotransferase [Kribbella qitaiheensis]QNE17160.1 NAD-dependent epimerase/dehydratase family protein [Kribbella qitaiheensis]